MFIKKISINNFRIYKGNNTIEFNINSSKNLYVVAGNNGYGKTSFLTALIWCLYGKKMAEVEEAYRKDIYNSRGYKNYAKSNLNKLSFEENETKYYVEIVFKNLNIPFLTTEEIVVRREYNINNDTEIVSVIIDGYENELTKEVGTDIFINDFILPKEIAKFFFFDSEKIVNIAELKSLEEMRNISKAYSEVLGIKKYEDLRENLKDLRLRFKQQSATKDDKIKFDLLKNELDKINTIIQINKEKLNKFIEEKEIKKAESQKIQEKLIREGQSLTIDELNYLRKENEKLLDKNRSIKKRFDELMELIPFAIVSKKMDEIRRQIEVENEMRINENITEKILLKRFKSLMKEKDIKVFIDKNIKSTAKSKFTSKFEFLIKEKLSLKNLSRSKDNIKILHSFSKEEQNEFISIQNSIKGFFKEQFNIVSTEYKQNQIDLRRISRKLSDAEKKEDDLIISSYRADKELIENNINSLDENIIKFLAQNEALQKESATKQKQLNELSKYIKLDSENIIKDETTEILINKLNLFLEKFKKGKKLFLEEKILSSLKILMHKKDFISNVQVDINNGFIEINLLNNYGKIINKNEMSKGEQQLFATAVLKALVEESNIKFPVFIDSPLQKFDIKHSKNVIQNFYPQIADQVVICPLLEKELTEKEYLYMIDNIENTFLIENKSSKESTFEKINPKLLFKTFKKQTADVF